MKLSNARTTQDLQKLLLAPDPMLRLENISAGSQPGFYLPNDAMFSDAFFSEPLTAYATGWKDPEDNQALVNFLAPDVEVSRKFEFKQGINAEEFYTDAGEDIRALGAEFKIVRYTGATVVSKTLNKGLAYRMDRDEATDPTKKQNQIVAKLLRRLWRNEAIRTITLISAAGVNTGVTWSTGTPDPEKDVIVANDAAQLGDGIYNNRILYAKDAWTKRFIGLGAANNPAGYQGRQLTVDQVAAVLGMDKGMVSKSVYQNTATAKARLLSNLVLSFYAMDGVDTEDPTHVKRFWTPTDSGQIRVYSQPVGSKFIDISVELYSQIVVTSTTGIAKLTVT